MMRYSDSTLTPPPKPAGYDRSAYELLARYWRAGYEPEFAKFDALISGKVDMINHGAASTDFIGMNHAFPESDYLTRETLFQTHAKWIKGLLWLWPQDSDVPLTFREKIAHWDWTKDEFL